MSVQALRHDEKNDVTRVYLQIRLRVYTPFMKEGYCAPREGAERKR